jgi:hypothetical protein
VFILLIHLSDLILPTPNYIITRKTTFIPMNKVKSTGLLAIIVSTIFFASCKSSQTAQTENSEEVILSFKNLTPFSSRNIGIGYADDDQHYFSAVVIY